MKTTRMRTRCLLLFGAALLGSGLGLAFHPTPAHALDPCTYCACKDVFAWWVTGLPLQGRGAKMSMTNMSINFGFPAGLEVLAGCKGGQAKVNGMCDLDDYNMTLTPCKAVNQAEEVSAVDMGMPFETNTTRYSCP